MYLRRSLLSLTVTASLFLGGCTPADVLSVTVPHQGYHRTEDIAYGKDPRQQLDIYVPEHARHAPVILYFPGGNWRVGHKDEYRFMAQAFTSKGFIVAVADYRLYPQIFFPAFVQDGAAALTYVRQHIAEYGGDEDNIFVAGDTGGAYIALMLSTDDSYLRNIGGTRAWIRGTIAISGMYEFLPYPDNITRDIFSKYPPVETQPIHHMLGKQPPLLLAVGSEESGANIAGADHIRKRLASIGSPVDEHIYPKLSASGLVLTLGRGLRDYSPLREDIAHFVLIHRHR